MTPKLLLQHLRPVPYFRAMVSGFNIPAPGITSKRAAHITVVLSLSDNFEKNTPGGLYIIYYLSNNM